MTTGRYKAFALEWAVHSLGTGPNYHRDGTSVLTGTG
jgi:hypothetical protein